MYPSSVDHGDLLELRFFVRMNDEATGIHSNKRFLDGIYDGQLNLVAISSMIEISVAIP